MPHAVDFNGDKMSTYFMLGLKSNFAYVYLDSVTESVLSYMQNRCEYEKLLIRQPSYFRGTIHAKLTKICD